MTNTPINTTSRAAMDLLGAQLVSSRFLTTGQITGGVFNPLDLLSFYRSPSPPTGEGSSKTTAHSTPDSLTFYRGASTTGDAASDPKGNSVYCNFGQYVIRVQLDQDGKFLGITEVAVAKSFLDQRAKLAMSQVRDVSEYYKDDE